MPTPPLITSLETIASDYDALLCDAWGVIHNGVALFDGAAEALIRFRETRGPVTILTNAPRPSSIIPGQLDRLGLPRGAWDAVVTSGDATRFEIERRLPQPATKIGPAKDDPLFEGLDMEFVAANDAAFMICTGLEDDQTETPEAYRPRLEAAAAQGLPMICANPDKVVRWGDRLIWCAGALAEIYESVGGKVIYGGKPHAPIYELALRRIGEVRGEPVAAPRVLAIGDGLQTDVLGANRQGIDVVYVAGDGGVHDGDAGDVGELLASAGANAIAVMERMTW